MTLVNYFIIFTFSAFFCRINAENTNTEVEYQDLVKRNHNPDEDNIIATDVTYIPAKAPQNHFYLSTVLSHKTKMILG